MRLFDFSLFFSCKYYRCYAAYLPAIFVCGVKFCYYVGQIIQQTGVLRLTCTLLKCLEYELLKSGHLIFRFP